jgi:hypothetical protein
MLCSHFKKPLPFQSKGCTVTETIVIINEIITVISGDGQTGQIWIV